MGFSKKTSSVYIGNVCTICQVDISPYKTWMVEFFFCPLDEKWRYSSLSECLICYD